MVDEDPSMKLAGSSKVSLSRERLVAGNYREIGSLPCYCMFSRLASASACFPSFEQNCSAVVAPHHLYLVNCDDYCIGVFPRNRLHLVQVQVS